MPLQMKVRARKEPDKHRRHYRLLEKRRLAVCTYCNNQLTPVSTFPTSSFGGYYSGVAHYFRAIDTATEYFFMSEVHKGRMDTI